MPKAVSVGPDGLYAAAAHHAWVSHIDRVNGAVRNTFPTTAKAVDVVLAGNGHACVFLSEGQWVDVHSINPSSGLETLRDGNSMYVSRRTKL